MLIVQLVYEIVLNIYIDFYENKRRLIDPDKVQSDYDNMKCYGANHTIFLRFIKNGKSDSV
jgi:hypothetical protein